MPYINVKTNSIIPLDKEESIKEKLGKEITILGKTEEWLMVDFNDNCRLYFKGSTMNPIAFVEVKLFGTGSNYGEFTSKVTGILQEELGITLDQIYVSYFETANWGYNGNNF